MKKFAYIEQCKKMHRLIQDGDFTPSAAQETGRSSTVVFRSLGHVQLESGEVIYIGEKSIRDKEDTTGALNRVTRDLQVGRIIADRCPNLLPLLPRFVGCRKTDDIPTIITEDATAGGRLRIRPIIMSDSTREILGHGFADFGEFDEVFESETINGTTSFDVDGVERLLDLTPAPYSHAQGMIIENAYKQAGSGIRDMLSVARELEFTLPSLTD